MAPAIQYLLTIGPLGFYLWLIALWQSGRHPRVVSGLLDHTLLSIGVGGVVAFGPLGGLVARKLFTDPDVFDWVTIVSSLGLVATVLARSSIKRVVVYHVSAEQIAQALETFFVSTNIPFVRTLHGYEFHEQGRGLVVKESLLPACVTIEAIGPDSEALIRVVRKGLRTILRSVKSRRSLAAFGFYLASLTTVLGPLLHVLYIEPRARDALRALLEWIRGA